MADLLNDQPRAQTGNTDTSSLTLRTKFDPFAMITGSPLRPGILCGFPRFFAEARILWGFAGCVGHSLWGLCPAGGKKRGSGDLAHNTIPTGELLLPSGFPILHTSSLLLTFVLCSTYILLENAIIDLHSVSKGRQICQN